MAPLPFFSSSDEVHTPAPDFFELKPVLRPGKVTDESRSAEERSPLPTTLWRKDVTAAGDGASYYKNKQFHQGDHIPSCFVAFSFHTNLNSNNITHIIRYKGHPIRDIVYLSKKLRDMTL